MADVVIVGGGPAGAAAAIDGARKGLDVVLLDKARFPRDKCCGDGLTANALRHLEALEVDPLSIPSWKSIEDVVLVDPSGRSRTFPLPRGKGQYAAVARRHELDAVLLQRAKDVGVTVHEGAEVVGVVARRDSVVATTSEGVAHTGRYLLAADGMWSPTRRMLGLTQPGYRGEWHAARQYVTNVSPAAQRDLVVWFDREFLPGYVWSFPLADGAANVGFGVVRAADRKGRDLKTLWSDVLERPYLRAFLGPLAEAESRYTAWPIPAALGRLPLTHGRVLFIGDAAAATDPMSGEGIGQALETGRLATELVAEAGPLGSPEQAAANYERELRRGMVKDHALAHLLSGGLGTATGANLSLGLAGLTPWTRRNFVRWLFEDYPRAALATPRRWRRTLFHHPGAYPQPR